MSVPDTRLNNRPLGHSLEYGLKLFPDFENAVSAMTRTGDTFQPDQKVHQIYQELYHAVYQKMYSRLQPLYNQIRKIVKQYPNNLK